MPKQYRLMLLANIMYMCKMTSIRANGVFIHELDSTLNMMDSIPGALYLLLRDTVFFSVY